MAKTSVDARKHIREWSEFFRDLREVSETIVDEFIKAHKKRKHLKQSLKRLIAGGLIQKRGGKLLLTSRGFIFFLRRNHKSFSKKTWDGKWRLISFDVPIADNAKRAKLRTLLLEYNFFPLQKSVWVCPSYLSAEFWRLVCYYGLDKYCKVMLVEIIDGDEDLRRHFKL